MVGSLRNCNSLLAVCVGIAVSCCALSIDAWAQQESSGADIAALLASDLRFEGGRSCASSRCHGNEKPGRFTSIRGDEFSIWFEKDPHAHGFQSLASNAAQQMMSNLGRVRDGQVLPATEDAQCLACHSPLVGAKRQGTKFFGQDGVSCEVCHGPAGGWLVDHHRSGWDRATGLQAGMTDTRKLWVRSEICVQCHVGTPEANVNHDLIAAGHPPLTFELGSYYREMPKHWDDSGERSRVPDLALRVWVAGQLAGADAALKITETRAGQAVEGETGASWPELAEYDCFACHHELDVSASWQPGEEPSPTRTGTAMQRWNNWYYTVLRAALDKDATSLPQLRETMQASFAPDAVKAHSLAAETRKNLAHDGGLVGKLRNFASVSTGVQQDQRLDAGLRAESDAVGALFSRLAAGEEPQWQDTAQLYLLLLAAGETGRERGLPGGGRAAEDDSFGNELRRLREGQEFPPLFGGLRSPGSTGQAPGESDARARFRALLRELAGGRNADTP